MTGRTLSDAFRTALYERHSAEALALLLTLRLTRSDGTVETRRLTNVPAGLSSDGNGFAHEPTELALPSVGADGGPRVRLEFSHADRAIGQSLRQMVTGEADLALALASAPDDVELSWPGLEIGPPQFDVEGVAVDLSYESLEREPFPGPRMTPSTAPGIH